VITIEPTSASRYIAVHRNEATTVPILTSTAKGQMILSKALLKHLGVQPECKIVVDALPCGRIELKAARPKGHISDVFNFLKREHDPTLSIDQINQIVTDSWSGKC
jgi:hypothetical protein